MGNRGSDRKRQALKRQLQKVETVCWLCGYPLDNDAPAFTDYATEVDEEVPASRGGDVYGVRTPCHLVHRCCNNLKDNSILEQYSLADWMRQRRAAEASIDAKPTSDWL